MRAGDGEIRVLHVDDEPDFADVAATFLEREDDRFRVETATTASDGLDRLSGEGFDCIVSDYDMPGTDGIELLEAVREEYPDLPFVLYTGKGSEEVASDAISSGVTDYLQKGGGTDQYTVLANRIRNAVERRRAERERNRHLEAIETAQEGISILDEDGHYIYVNRAFADLHGYDPGEMIGEHWELAYPDEDVPEVREEILPEVERAGYWHGETTSLRADGSTVAVDHTLSTTDRGELICTVRDISDRKERERELRQTTARLEALFENSPDMINVHDTDGNIIDPNRRLCEETGYDVSELTEMRVWDLDRSIDPDEARSLWEGMEVGDRRRFAGTYRRRDGSTFPVEVHIRCYRLEGRDRFVAVARDVSERREQRSELERYERLVQNLPVGVFRTTPDGDFVDVNQEYMSLLGAESKADLAGAEATDFWADPDDREALLNQLEREGIVEDRRIEVETLDGESKWVEATVRITEQNGDRYLEGIALDVTGRRERRRRLEQAATMFENAQDALFLVDAGEAFTIERVNPAYEEATGLSDDALSGRTPRDVLGDDQGADIERKYRECVEQRTPLEYEEELAIDGDRTYWETRIAPVVIDGEVERIVGATRDITERKRREQELQRSERRFEAMFEDPNILAGLIDTDGTVLDINETAMEYLDTELADVTGEPFWETPWFTGDEEVQADVREWVERAANGEYVGFEVDLSGAVGDRLIVSGVFRPVTNDDGEVVSLLISDRDITERKERERELRRTERRYRAILEDPNILAGVLDTDGRLLEANRTAMDYVDADREDVVGEPFWNTPWWPEEMRPVVRENVERAADGEYVEYEADLTKPDGERYSVEGVIRPVTDEGTDVVSMIVSARDVTPERERERRLEQYERIVETMDDVAFVVDEEWNVEFVNETISQYVDVPIDTLEGQPVMRLAEAYAAGDDAPERFERSLERTFRRESETESPERMEVTLDVDGEMPTFEYQFSPLVSDGETTAAVITMRDITERKRRERELQRYETLIERLPIGYVRTSFDDEFLTMNSTFVEMLDGESAAEIRSHDVSEFYRDATTRERLLATFREEGEVDGEEVKVTTMSGETIWIAVTGRLIEDDEPYIDALVQDITERKRYEEELREERAFIEQCLNALEDVFYVFGPDGEILRWNDRLPEVTGYSEREIAEMEPTDFFPPDHTSRISEAVTEIAETGSTTVQADYLTKDGERIPHEFTGFELTDADGEMLGFAGIGRDLTRQREYERQLERRNERLEEFASIVSHDLRNPLNVAEARLELLREECDSEHEHIEYADRALDRMEALIDDLLALAREGKTVTDPEPVDLAAVVEDCWATVETADARLVTDIDRTVHADRSRLKQVFENLVRNAVEHGGDVTVTVGELDDGFYVEDDGPGIPEDERDDVFAAGYSTDEGGTGFGLSIVERIVEAHGWEIRVTEGSESGPRFEITGVEFGVE